MSTPDSHPTEQLSSHNDRPSRGRRISACLLSLVILTGAPTAVLSIDAFGKHERAVQKAEDDKNLYDKMQKSAAEIRDGAYNQAQQVARNAIYRADTLEHSMNSLNPRMSGYDVLNGEIEIRDPSGNFVPSYKDPILLCSPEKNPDYTDPNSFLPGAYYAIQGNNAQGDITLTAHAFDPNEERFVPDDPDFQVYTDLDIYAASMVVDGSNADVVKTLYAASEGSPSQAYNADGTPITPSLAHGMH